MVAAVVGDVIGGSLDCFRAVAHGDADIAILQHCDIIVAVAEGHGVVSAYTMNLKHFCYAFAFAAAFGDNVAEIWIPACRTAALQHI